MSAIISQHIHLSNAVFVVNRSCHTLTEGKTTRHMVLLNFLWFRDIHHGNNYERITIITSLIYRLTNSWRFLPKWCTNVLPPGHWVKAPKDYWPYSLELTGTYIAWSARNVSLKLVLNVKWCTKELFLVSARILSPRSVSWGWIDTESEMNTYIIWGLCYESVAEPGCSSQFSWFDYITWVKIDKEHPCLYSIGYYYSNACIFKITASG